MLCSMAKRPLLTEYSGRGLAIVAASFVIHILATAMTRCTGVLFSTFQNEFRSSAAQTGAICSIMSASSFFGCTLGGVLANRFGCRFTAIFGGVLNIVGTLGGALTRNIYQMYVFGTVVGLGIGVAFTPAVAIVPQYFDTAYPIVSSFITLGDGIGIMAFGPLMQLLLNTYGWRGMLLITGAITANICAAGATFRTHRVKVPSSGGANHRRFESNNFKKPVHSLDAAKSASASLTVGLSPRRTNCFRTSFLKVFRLNLLWQSYRFAVFCFAQTMHSMAFTCFMLYLVPRATTAGVSDQNASFLLSVVGIASIAGRLLCGILAQRVPPEHIYRAAMLGSGCALFVGQLDRYAYLVVCAILFGISLGFHRVIVNVLTRDYVGVNNVGSAIGIYCAFCGVADLLGPILAGALYDATNSFSVVFYVLAAVFILGFLAMLGTTVLRRFEPGVPKIDD